MNKKDMMPEEGEIIKDPKIKSLLSLFINARSTIHYAKKCLRCINSCKQSYKADIIQCPKYKKG